MNLPQFTLYFGIKISPDVEMTSAVSFRPTGRLHGGSAMHGAIAEGSLTCALLIDI